MGRTEIIHDTQTILHIINIQDLIQTLDSIKNGVKDLQIGDDMTIRKTIENIQAKISAIEPEKTRHKRGLINIIGTAQKWLFGTMDDNDRQEIIEHLNTIEENDSNAIFNLNKQIKINSHFNDSIFDLKNIIETDRRQLAQTYEELSINEKRIIKQQFKTDQILKLLFLKEKVNQIIDTIAQIKLGMVHPSILTATEITETRLDFYKLKNVKVGILKYDKNRLIIAMKIPNTYKLADFKLITASPTETKHEVIIEDQYVIEINETMYEYNPKILYEKELIPINNCILNHNCKLKENRAIEIKSLDDYTVLCKNMNNIELINNCDDRKINLNGNYLIVLNNCSIQILNQTFSNKNVQFVDRFFYEENVKYNFTKKLNFEEIILKNIVNLKPIKLLKFHKNIHYVIGSSTIILIFVFIFVVINISKKHKTLNVSIKNMKEKYIKNLEENCKETPKIQENFNLKGGEVTYPAHSSTQSIFS